MRQRCADPSNHVYGGRGIRVCERWERSFQAFLDDMGPRPGDEYSIDRIDTDGNYEPGNCRWTTRYVQNRNRNNNRMLTAHGVTMCMTDWALKTGLRVGTISERLRAGWSAEDALTMSLWMGKPYRKREQRAQIGA